MNKTIKTFLAVVSSLFITAASYAAPGFTIGASGSLMVLAAEGTETKDTGNTVTEYGAMEASHGAVFIEVAPNANIAIGLEAVIHDIDSDENINIQHDGDTSGEGGGANTGTATTNKAKASIEDMMTLYVMFKHDNGVYVKVGAVSGDVITKEVLGTGGSYGNVDLEGITLGLGFRNELDNGAFIGVELAGYEIDDMEASNTSDANNTKKVLIQDVLGASASIKVGKTF